MSRLLSFLLAFGYLKVHTVVFFRSEKSWCISSNGKSQNTGIFLIVVSRGHVWFTHGGFFRFRVSSQTILQEWDIWIARQDPRGGACVKNNIWMSCHLCLVYDSSSLPVIISNCMGPYKWYMLIYYFKLTWKPVERSSFIYLASL